MTVEWILILTMVTNGGAVIHTVDRFATAQACQAAGAAWFEKTLPNFDRTRYTSVVPNYVCVAR